MVHVTFSYPSDDSDVTLHVKGYDSGIVSVESTSVQLDSSGNGTLVIQGVSVGSTQITVEDAIGGEDTADVDVVPPGVISTGSETQGAKYNANNMPGFTFSIGDPSLTPVTIDYNTLGSTLPSSLMGNLLAGSVTIDAGDTSTFVPFTVPDDGKIAPTRVAVVTLVVPGDTQPASKQMAVTNTDEPTIKMNDASDNAVIPLDPQGDKNKLTTISLDASKHDGTIVSWTLTWNPNDFLMWTTDEIGIAGTDDLESLGYPNIHGYGSSFDPYSGRVSFTGEGAPPSKLYGQDLDGSSNWDTTSVQLSVEVEKAATAAVPLAVGSAYNTANGTANGYLVYWGGRALPTTAVRQAEPKVAVGQSISAQAVWQGPGNPLAGAQPISFKWTNDGVISGGIDVTANKGGAATVDKTAAILSFIWVTGNFNGKDESVTCTLSAPGRPSQTATGYFNVVRPNFTVSSATTGWNTVPFGNGQELVLAVPNPLAQGITFKIAANTSEPNGFKGGQTEWVQVVKQISFTYKYTNFSPPPNTGNGLDNTYPYLTFVNGNPTDSPNLSTPNSTIKSLTFSGSFQMFLMWKPPTPGSGWVPIQEVDWNAQATDQKNGNNWTTKGTVSPNPSGQDTTDYPTWKSVFINPPPPR